MYRYQKRKLKSDTITIVSKRKQWQDKKKNKTPDFSRADFRSPTLLNMIFRRMKALFFREKLQIFQLFEIWKFPVFFAKLQFIGEKRHFEEIIWIDTVSTANFPPKKFKFYFQKHIISAKRKQIASLFEKFFYFSRILRQICYNLVVKKTNSGHSAIFSKRKERKLTMNFEIVNLRERGHQTSKSFFIPSQTTIHEKVLFSSLLKSICDSTWICILSKIYPLKLLSMMS